MAIVTMRVSLFLFLFSLSIHADNIGKAAESEISINAPPPEKMVSLPKGDAYQPMFDMLTPPGSLPIMEAVAPYMLKDRDKESLEPVFMAIAIIPAASLAKDESDEDFKALVTKANQKFLDGNQIKDSDAPHYDLIKKRVAEYSAKAGAPTNISGSSTACLGILDQTPLSLSLIFVRDYTMQVNGSTLPQQAYSTISYVHLKHKIVVATIVRSSGNLGPSDVDTLKDTTKRYMTDLVSRN